VMKREGTGNFIEKKKDGWRRNLFPTEDGCKFWLVISSQ